MPPATRPIATYRLQLTPDFTFSHAHAVVDYLAALGVSHAYTSNYFKAVPGSTHGYNVVDPTILNPEIGNPETYNGWVAALRRHGMGHIIDLVPNHMGIARSANPWWQDVLENGESSRYAEVFDIDWRPLKPELDHKVLLPVLGDIYGAVLERQEIRLEYADGSFQARYFDQTFPIAPGTYDRLLDAAAPGVLEEVGASSEMGVEYLSILTAIRHLPPREAAAPGLREERDREKEVIKRRLAGLASVSPAVRAHVERVVAAFNGVRGDPRSFDALDELLGAQAYRLAYWRVAAEEINYRRFFDVNELAAIRVEDPEVFERVHALALELLARGAIDGFRIDHVDGLYDPGDYLARVQARAAQARPDVFGPERPLYVIVEKILGHGEALPDWPVEGTTGYDFLVAVNALFVDTRNERAFTSVYETFTRLRDAYREIVYRGKQLVLRLSMASELNVLANHLNRFSERHRYYRDFTVNSLAQAMAEIIACFPVYRTYINEREAQVSDRDRAYIEHAVREAKRRNPDRPWAVYDFVRDVLLRRADYIPDRERQEHLQLVGRFQQLTSPVTAKGIEDTALYIYNRLVSLNEVGGEPDRFGMTPDALHTWMQERARRWPYGLSTTSTHDTKRSEDVRARLNALSEIPGAWKQAATRWARANRRARTTIDGRSFPSRNEEYLLYQTLLGSWPATPMDAAGERDYTARIVAYMRKAIREAKVHTSWLNPSEPHEQAMTHFVETILSPDNEAFRADFLEFWARIARFGVCNALAQVTLKITAPGVPDFYQGSEIWDFSLVDPDNRRPVDYARRRALLADLDAAIAAGGRGTLVRSLMSDLTGDRSKLYVTASLLRFRQTHRHLFDDGAYEPSAVEGSRREHLFAFTRARGPAQVLVAVPRLIATLSPDGEPPVGDRIWGDTRIAIGSPGPGVFHNVLTGACVAVHRDAAAPYLRAADVFEAFPVACLEAR
jgi:(1->4)-alpha-D-glucan 1-alpha-D-glucosylmutase